MEGDCGTFKGCEWDSKVGQSKNIFNNYSWDPAHLHNPHLLQNLHCTAVRREKEKARERKKERQKERERHKERKRETERKREKVRIVGNDGEEKCVFWTRENI